MRIPTKIVSLAAAALAGSAIMLTSGTASAAGADEDHQQPFLLGQSVDDRTETSLTVSLYGRVYDTDEATFELDGDLSASIEADCTPSPSIPDVSNCRAESVVLDGLTPNRGYDIDVSIVDAFGVVSQVFWQDVIRTSTDVTAPSVPTGLTYTPREEGNPDYNRFGRLGVFSWDVATDNVSPTEEIRYNVYVDDIPTPVFFFVPPTYDGVHSVDFGVEAECGNYPLSMYGDSFELRVTAVDRAGNESAKSEPLLMEF